MVDRLDINYAGNMAVALQIAGHILNPCVEPKTGGNIRDFYIREAARFLNRIGCEDPAYRFLRAIIDEYEDSK